MAENETLDLWSPSNRRWQAFFDSIVRGDSPDALADEAIACLCRIFKRLPSLLPLKELLDAARSGPVAAKRVARRCRRGRDYAELMAQQASFQSDPVAIITGVALAALDRILEQIKSKVVPGQAFPDFCEFTKLRNAVVMRVAPRIESLARKVAEAPDQGPRMPPVRKAERERQQRALLAFSLQPCSGTHG